MLEGKLFNVLGIESLDRKGIALFTKALDISFEKLKYYNDYNILPSSTDLGRITSHTGISELKIRLKMGIVDDKILQFLSDRADKLEQEIPWVNNKHKVAKLKPSFQTELGKLYRGDCLSFIKTIPDESFDLIFADPPFNLDKFYLSNIDDNLSSADYIDWCKKWLDECVRTLKPTGSLFVWNLPKWNAQLASFLSERLTFRNWIACDIKFSLPIHGKLYPSHYSLLYYCKDKKPASFHPDRLAMETCKSCYNEIKDYGGYKNKMNPLGINLSDVWTDIPPVRHSKYKKRKEANELSIKLLDRIIEMASEPGDMIFDPFGGSGTTYIVAEIKRRKWTGIELGPVDTIIERFGKISEEKEYLIDIRKGYNSLFTDSVKKKRIKKGLWTDESFNENVE